jgi:tRNA modification GTPase
MDRFEHTIASLSTPVGESGIAVVRVSGSRAFSLLTEMFRTVRGAPVEQWEHQKIYHGFLVADDGEIVDEVMAAVMRGPDSYTGEDLAEISCHGSTLIVEQVLEQLFSRGARMAEPGEYTKRAFLNGKIDLIQAEAICDLIHARSHLQRRVAQEQLRGTLSQGITRLADELVSLLSVVEASIDFIEEDIEPLDRIEAQALLERHLSELDELLASSAISRPFREGFRVTVAGPVNAGKSSIFNKIIGEQRAIVTEIPGTTRDLLREPLLIEGLLFLLQDTAGLREETGDRVEEIGLGLAREAIRDADCVLYVIDGSQQPVSAVTTNATNLDSERTVVVVNKNDLPAALVEAQLERLFSGLRRVSVSALTGEGCDKLREQMLSCVGAEAISRVAAERVVLNSRLINLLRKARTACESTAALFVGNEPLEILAVELRGILAQYEEATGRKYSDSLLDRIFSRFCIGK